MRGARPLEALEAALADEVGAAPGEVLLAAVSGGADSVALAALLSVAAARGGATLVLAHVNHGLRASAGQDEAVVLAVGAALGARAIVAELGPGSAAEARLREERYAALVRVAAGVGARRVFTAHHARDQAETVMLALLRGCGPAGLGGMARLRPLVGEIALARPLLGVEPGELRAYCCARHLPFALDPSNADPGYRRNAVRAALAGLRESFPHLDAAIARCAAIAAEEAADAPRAAARAAVRAALAASGAGTQDVSFERLDAAARALERGRPGRHFLRRGVELITKQNGR